MVSSFKGWSNLPKSIKLLDISLIGYLIILIVAIFLYLNFLDRIVQNLMPIFLAALLLLLTWNFRKKLLQNPDLDRQKNLLRNWFIICLLIIIAVSILILAYPVTY